ncbi:ABC transporter ATP-binding protein [Paenibacillus sp. B1-33]|uniref:ABC transporter ATP-binding protein n=1 Tax=unclassified Paenibacillus TaxID=185978 RepID=UPI003D2BCC53
MTSTLLLPNEQASPATREDDIEPHPNIAIAALNVSLAFEHESEPILSGIECSIMDGETVLLLGPSGCGKSSLAFCLAGLYPYAIDSFVEGSIQVYGKPIEQYGSGEVAQIIGIVFQDFESQFCMLRVEEEVAFCLENRNCPRTDMEPIIYEVLEKVGLLGWRQAYIHELSGGMKQKLALACALALRVKMLVLDEPTSNLDPYTRRQFAALIAELAQKEGVSLLIIEHQLDDWIGFADRLLVMNERGELAFDGLPAAYFEQHAAEAKSHGIWLPQAFELQRTLQQTVSSYCSASGLTHYPALTDDELLNMLLPLSAEIQKAAVRILTPAKPKPSQQQRRTVLKAEGLAYQRQGRSIIHNASLTLYEGEWAALVGPNGAGKSTLASLLSGLTQPSDGHILLQDLPLHRYAERELRAHIGYIFQNPEHQFITDTVFDEIAFGMRMQHVEEEEVNTRVAEALARFRLSKVAKANPFSISQGQKRRLSVASVLTDSQQLLLCDEPTYGQDAYTSKQLMDMLQMRVQAGATVLMITHDMEWVQAYADRVIVLDQGHIRYDGCPSELWTKHPELVEACHLRMPINFAIAEQLQALIFARKEVEGQ